MAAEGVKKLQLRYTIACCTSSAPLGAPVLLHQTGAVHQLVLHQHQ